MDRVLKSVRHFIVRAFSLRSNFKMFVSGLALMGRGLWMLITGAPADRVAKYKADRLEWKQRYQ